MLNRYVIVDCCGDSVTITNDPEFVLNELNNDCLDDGKPFSVGYVCVPVGDWQKVNDAVKQFDASQTPEVPDIEEMSAFDSIAEAAIVAVRNMRET